MVAPSDPAAALAHYGLAAARLTPLARGIHDTFRVDAPGGESFLLRIYGAGTHTAEAIRSEAAWLETLRRDAGLLVPPPVPANGTPVVTLSGPAPRHAALFGWLPGNPAGASLTPAHCRRFGELMGRMHRQSERFVPPPWFTRLRYDLPYLLADAGDGGGLFTAADREVFRTAAAIVRREIEELGQGRDVFGLIHGDLQITNFLLHRGQVAAIDFADFGWGYYPYDIAASLLPAWGRSDFPVLEAAFLRGYRQVRSLAAAHQERLEAFAVARALFVLRWTVEQLHIPSVRETGTAIIPSIRARIQSFLERRQPERNAGRTPEPRGPVQLLAQLGDQGIRLWAEGGRLCFKAPEGTLTPALRSELAARKAEILAFLEQTASGAAALPMAIRPVPRDGALPLSFAQQRLWVLDQLEPGSTAYNLAQIVRLVGALQVPVLARSLAEVVRRHEVLRTTFDAADGQPAQVIAPAGPVPLPLIDIAALPQGMRDDVARRLANAEAARPFDLRRGPLLRFLLLRLTDREHRLLLSTHHIISDGWSSTVLSRELALLYQAFAAGRPSPLSELAIQYADFAHWQREYLQGTVFEAQISYWRQQLQGAPDILELPADRPRPPVQSYRGARHVLRLPVPTAEALRPLARQEGATLFMVLFAAFATLLYRWSDQGDVLVGSPIANRNRSEIEPLIGFFVNTLVLRACLADSPTFRELLAQVRRTTLDAYDHQDLPFERLVEVMQPNRDASHTPLFQELFTFQNNPAPAFDLAGLQLSLTSPDKTAVPFDLDLTLQEADGGIRGTLSYATDLFDAPTMLRFANHLVVLAESAGRSPDRRVDSLPLLTAEERHLLLTEWNDSGAVYPHDLPFDELFAAQAACTPEAPAVGFQDTTWTYAELDRRAAHLARHLAAAGVARGEAVALLASRAPEFVAAILAIFRVGAGYMPLDPAHPAQRLAGTLGLSGARTVVVAAEHAGVLAEALVKLPEVVRPRGVCLEDALDTLPDVATDGLSDRGGPDHLAYVIFTSGSTGVPKGAMVTQRGLMNHLFGLIEILGLGAGDTLAQTAPQCFDISVWQFLTPLLVGGRVQIFPPEVSGDPTGLPREVDAAGVTVLQLVPSQLGQILDDEEQRSARRLAGLRWMIPTGEALPPKLAHRWLEAYPAIPLLNAYGPAECSDDVAVHTLREPLPPEVANAPIGRPVPNLRLCILNRDLQQAPVGAPGEICVAGQGVGRGYLGDPGRTAEAFVPDPVSPGLGERLYRTGDLGRRLPDGTLEFLGRVDHQVKVRGFRIELGEIEAALGGHPSLQEAVVVSEGERGSAASRLVAYLVAQPGATLTVEELRRLLGCRLPTYMVPSLFVLLDAMPLNANGKVDRGALSATAGVRLGLESSHMPPRTPLEEEIAAIWRELLGLEQISIHDRFFDLGGHSLLATTLISRVRETFGVDVGLATFFKEPTVAALAEAVEVIHRTLVALHRPRTVAASDRELGEL